eukprot:GHVL01021769.1.p1 GENE.GHVL01021769.1~~GHVL01021769.1.p1  ORF type:complete len:140 (-),score=33.18 GHVL01021769.1:296-715(-)
MFLILYLSSLLYVSSYIKLDKYRYYSYLSIKYANLYNITEKPTSFNSIWEFQKKIVNDTINSQNKNIDTNDTLIFTQHDHVFSLGKGYIKKNIKFIQDTNIPKYFQPLGSKGPSIEIIEVERGGDVTYHGPGQLIMCLV